MAKSNIINLTSIQPAPEPRKTKPRNSMPDGRKRIRIDIGADPDTGKRIRKTFTGKTLKECYAKRDAWLEEQKASSKPHAQTVAEWAETWQEVYGSSSGYSQNRTVDIDVRRLICSIGDMQMSDVMQMHIQAYALSVSEYAKSTVQKIKATTARIFDSAVANKIIAVNPCTGVQWKHTGEGTHRFLDAWEIQLITENWNAHHAGMWAMLMLYAGLRRGEALALRWSDIDLDALVIHVSRGVHFESNASVIGTPKTESSVRDVPIFPPLAKALNEAFSDTLDKNSFVCTGAAGQQVTLSIWASGWRAYNNAMTRAASDIPEHDVFSIRAHDLRHTFASMLYDAGVDIKTAQKLLGHAAPEITMRIYTHLSEMYEARSVDKMTEYLNNMGHKWGTNTQKTQ